MPRSRLGTSLPTRLDGQTVVITGASTGIGKITAKELVRRGARVIVVGRNEERCREAIQEIKEDLKDIKTEMKIEFQKMDLSSLASVKEGAEKLEQRLERIDVLINNAGMFAPPTRTVSPDGFEVTFATNHLGHFLLTNLLMPLLKKSKEASTRRPRIIILSSDAHAYYPMDWEDIQAEQEYVQMKVYSRSKLLNVLHGKELSRRLEPEGILVCIVHPGLVKTEIARRDDHPWGMRLLMQLLRPFTGTAAEGAETSLFCALSEDIDTTGEYFADCKVKRPARNALIEGDQKRLWDISEKMVQGAVGEMCVSVDSL